MQNFNLVLALLLLTGESLGRGAVRWGGLGVGDEAAWPIVGRRADASAGGSRRRCSKGCLRVAAKGESSACAEPLPPCPAGAQARYFWQHDDPQQTRLEHLQELGQVYLDSAKSAIQQAVVQFDSSAMAQELQ